MGGDYGYKSGYKKDEETDKTPPKPGDMRGYEGASHEEGWVEDSREISQRQAFMKIMAQVNHNLLEGV